jgi:hypothetical protein
VGKARPRVVLVHGDIFNAPARFAAMEPPAANHRLVLGKTGGASASARQSMGRTSTLTRATLAEVLAEEPTHLVGHTLR